MKLSKCYNIVVEKKSNSVRNSNRIIGFTGNDSLTNLCFEEDIENVECL